MILYSDFNSSEIVNHTESSTIYSNLIAKYNIDFTAISIDSSGNYAGLIGQKGLYIIDLENPYEIIKTYYHQTKSKNISIEWNPHVLNYSMIASTSNHNTILWDLNHSSSSTFIRTLRAHKRPISNINWSPILSFYPILATCSIDGYAFLWDIRLPSDQPFSHFYTNSSYTKHIKWNKLNENNIAIVNDGDIRIWDIRFLSSPLLLITAHKEIINQIDWNPSPYYSYEFITCSQDKSLKIWDFTKAQICQGVVTTEFPISNAKYTPFGCEITTCSNKIENDISIWKINRPLESSTTSDVSSSSIVKNMENMNDQNLNRPKDSITLEKIHELYGHNSPIKDIVWRIKSKENDQNRMKKTFQLISISTNQELKMWRTDIIDPKLSEYKANKMSTGRNKYKNRNKIGSSDQNDDIPSGSYIPNSLVNNDCKKKMNDFACPYNEFDINLLKNDFDPIVIPSSAIVVIDKNVHKGNCENSNDLSAMATNIVQLDGDEECSEPKSNVKMLKYIENHKKNKSSKLAAKSNLKNDTKTAEYYKQTRYTPGTFDMYDYLYGTDTDTDENGEDINGNNVNDDLPCPRLSGGFFSGPNILVYFCSIDKNFEKQSNENHSNESKSFVRTYGGLTRLRKNPLSSKYNNNNDNLMFDENEYKNYFFETGDWFRPFSGNKSNKTKEHLEDTSVHGGNEYLKLYFTNSEYHLPINNPNHRISINLNNSTSKSSSILSTLANKSSVLKTKKVYLWDFSTLCCVERQLIYNYTFHVYSNVDATSLSSNIMENKATVDYSSLQNNTDFERTSLETNSMSLNSYENFLSRAIINLKTSHNNSDNFSSIKRSASSSALNGNINNLNRRFDNKKSKRAIFSQSFSPPTRLDHKNQLIQQKNKNSPILDLIKIMNIDNNRNSSMKQSTLVILCESNAQAALNSNRKDLFQIWSLIKLCCSCIPNNHKYNNLEPWSEHPFGKYLVENLFEMFEKKKDFQTLGSVSSILNKSNNTVFNELNNYKFEDITQYASLSDFMTISKIENKDPSYHFNQENNNIKSKKSSHYSKEIIKNVKGENKFHFNTNNKNDKSKNNGFLIFQTSSHKHIAKENNIINIDNTDLLDKIPESKESLPELLISKKILVTSPESNIHENKIKKNYQMYQDKYTDLLYSYGAFVKRREILKYFNIENDNNNQIQEEVLNKQRPSIHLLCNICKMPSLDKICENCNIPIHIRCVLCQIIIKKRAIFCLWCGHGGHENHLDEWFQIERKCPSGCGCLCMFEEIK